MEIGCYKVRKIQKEMGCSIQEAHRIAVKEDMMEAAKNAETFEDLKKIVIRLTHKL